METRSDSIMHARPLTTDHGGNATQQQNVMPYTCQPCARRKVKCDRPLPICLSCNKAKRECFYQAPAPRRAKRKRSETVYERLARYEHTLRENGLLAKADAASPSRTITPEGLFRAEPLHANHPEPTKDGKLLSGAGKALYVDSGLWRDLGEKDMLEMSGDEEDDHPPPVKATLSTEDLISTAMLGIPEKLVEYHPSPQDAMKLWTEYVENVEPLCKVLHVPTTTRMVERLSQQPTTASKPQECLLFAIYHFAIFSMTEEDCVREFGQLQPALLTKYQRAIRQALVNASWLKTTAILVMQAYVLFLVAVRTRIDPHTFWILTGVAVRIAQRMGLHRDGEALRLPPFDVEMRRRLFWQLLPLDGYAGQVSGTGISIPPNSWDTKQPSNINDDQIYPGMTPPPEEQKGATEMIYCLARTELSKLYTQSGVILKEIGATIQLKDPVELEKLIDEVESTIEVKYLRYCDIVDPLHFLTLGMVRCAANVVRLHSRMAQSMKQSIGDQERRQLCALAQKILDTDTAAYSHPHMKKFHWSFRTFFLGDALICILASLAKVGFFSRIELDFTWAKMAEAYSNHPEIVEGKRAIHIVVGKVTLKAWMANPPTGSVPEPDFITALRSSQPQAQIGKRPNTKKVGDVVGGDAYAGAPQTRSPFISSPSADADALFGKLDTMDLDLGDDFNLDVADWTFWDQLLQDYDTLPA